MNWLKKFLKKIHMYDFAKKVFRRFICKDPLDDYKKMGLVLGKNFKMMHGVSLDYCHTWHIEIGDDVTLAPYVLILAHDTSTKTHLNYTRIGKVKIGHRVFIGAHSVVLPNVAIGDDVIIGAGSVISKDIPDGHVAAGNPAKIICTTEAFLARKREEMTIHPCFGEEYTVRNKITAEMRDEMNLKMKDNIGYVI